MKKEIELLTDPTFETGFHLLGISPVKDQRTFYRHLDYNKEAKPSNRVVWQMAQWWTPYNVADAHFEKSGDTFIYKTASRTIGINPKDDGLLKMDLLGSKEYLGKTRKGFDQPWAHLLIEQDFKESVPIDSLESLVLNLTFQIDEVVDQNHVLYNPDLHAAQLLWYLVIADKSDDRRKSQNYGNYEDFFWFGIPIYDNRHKFINETMHIDQGGIGTTGRLIYSMDNRNYLNEVIKFNKEYTIAIDILPFVKKARAYALENGYLPLQEKPNYEIGYMNFGWELPGAFDVKSWIKGMSIKAIKK
jgi:hypothetical protein